MLCSGNVFHREREILANVHLYMESHKICSLILFVPTRLHHHVQGMKISVLGFIANYSYFLIKKIPSKLFYWRGYIVLYPCLLLPQYYLKIVKRYKVDLTFVWFVFQVESLVRHSQAFNCS